MLITRQFHHFSFMIPHKIKGYGRSFFGIGQRRTQRLLIPIRNHTGHVQVITKKSSRVCSMLWNLGTSSVDIFYDHQKHLIKSHWQREEFSSSGQDYEISGEQEENNLVNKSIRNLFARCHVKLNRQFFTKCWTGWWFSYCFFPSFLNFPTASPCRMCYI